MNRNEVCSPASRRNPPSAPPNVIPVFSRPLKAGAPCMLLFVFSVVFVAILHSLPAHAYPPAPHHEFYGVVRDEMGHPFNSSDAEVILEAATGVRLTTRVISNSPRMNYVLPVPMDSGITPDAYKPTAIRPTVGFTFRVRIGSTIYLPIEVKADYSILGQPGRRTRFDLTLGEDVDGDGLPDAWERALLAGGTLSDVRPDQDADGDGLSNSDEYIAGTLAYDRSDGFSLRVVEIENGAPELEFMAVRGRTYSIFASSDMNTWTQVRFRLPSDTASTDRLSYETVESRVVRLRAATEQGALRFFKLRVQ